MRQGTAEMSGAATHCHRVYCDKMHKHTHMHTRIHTPAITSVPSASNQSMADPVALLMRFSRMDVLVRENVPIQMSRQSGVEEGARRGGQGTEGVIKLKRLGEDELLRIYESRHWLHKANPVLSAFKGALGGKGRGGRVKVGGLHPCV